MCGIMFQFKLLYETDKYIDREGWVSYTMLDLLASILTAIYLFFLVT
jgi:hypothetical protein